MSDLDELEKLTWSDWIEVDGRVIDARGAIKELIERVRQAEARIAEAAKLHRRRDDLEYHWGGGSVCDGCGDEDGWASKWPCETAVALGLNEGDER